MRGYGPIHTPSNQQALRGEPELLFLKALETNVRASNVGMLVDKAPFFERATIRPTTTIQPGSMMPDEALVWCLNDRGQVAIGHIATLCGTSEDVVITALAGRIFRVPGSDTWQTADEYLSGNIHQKLLAAERAAHDDAYYAAN